MSSKTFIQRIKKIERPTTDPRWLVAIFDESKNSFSGSDLGEEPLTPEELKIWQEKQDKNTQILIIEVVENKQINVKNYVDKSTSDLLKRYESLIRKSESNSEAPKA